MVVIVAVRACGGGRWTWQAMGMMCDSMVTPEVEAVLHV
jgi:hypothetical protein